MKKLIAATAGAVAVLGMAVLLLTRQSGSDGFVPLPDLPTNRPIELRVALLENPRLDSYTAEEWGQVLEITRELAQSHFGLDVVFAEPVPLSLTDVFNRLDRNLSDFHKSFIAGLKPEEIDWNRMNDAILSTLPTHDKGVSAAFETVKEHTGARYSEMSSQTIEVRRKQLALILSDVLKQKLSDYQSADSASILAVSSRPGRPGYNEWIYWDAVPSLALPFDVYLTNQPVISVEYTNYPIHAVLGGGVTTGTTSGANEGRYGTGAWVTNFFEITDIPDFAAVRGGPPYQREQSIKLTAFTLTHELGHLLLHLGHPWENSACIMTPSRRETADGAFERLNPSACPIGSSPDMTPGAARIPGPYFEDVDH